MEKLKKCSNIKWQDLSFRQRINKLENYLKFLQINIKCPEFAHRNRHKFDKLNKALIIKTTDYFKGLLSLYNETSTPKPCLHQILFCTPETSEIQAQTFIFRALHDPLKRLFCLVGFDKLSYSVSKVIISCVSSHLSSEIDPEFYLAFLINRNHSAFKDSTKISKKYEIQKEANDGFLKDFGEFVTSKAPGMGKTFYIQKHIRNTQENPQDRMFSMMLSGKISNFKIKNLGKDLAIIENNQELDLHLKINYFSNLNNADYLISIFIFKVVYFRLTE